ncbi:hypothetical protein GJAV_G00120730 [Gymnothorax javanicus]|nr:hypothetical protein GJAV_G00120730 [Gymnothorax javanicus]
MIISHILPEFSVRSAHGRCWTPLPFHVRLIKRSRVQPSSAGGNVSNCECLLTRGQSSSGVMCGVGVGGGVRLQGCITVALHPVQWLRSCVRTRCSLAKMSSKLPSASSLSQERRTVQQLRVEASMERIKVSKASADLMHYCGEHAKYDPLLMGIPASDNPFKDKKPCTIL